MVDETENSIHYVWSVLAGDILKNIDYNVDVMILDASDIHFIPLDIVDVTNDIKNRLIEKLILIKFMLPTEKIDSLLEELDIDMDHTHKVEDFMNRCSHFLDELVNYYVPVTGNKLLFNDNDLLATDDLDKGIILKNMQWIGNDDINKLLLSFALFRKRGVI